ncbi:MAG: hypothetical protein JWP66_1615 [Naasia sp.]|nr:hypothetical protein [Naasia sp.]
MSDQRADGPSNPGEGGEHRFDDVAPEPQTSTEDSTQTDGETGPETGTGETTLDPASGTADGAVEPPD